MLAKEGKDLPVLTEVNGDVSGYRERLFKFVESQSVELSFSERIAPAKGLSHGGKITLLVHEIAHEMLHHGERRTMTTKQVRETEAEAVAFVVCQSVGLQNGTASQDYIQLWHGDANLLPFPEAQGHLRKQGGTWGFPHGHLLERATIKSSHSAEI